MGGEEERLASALLSLKHKSQSRKRGNIDICGTREISDLARPLGTMTTGIVAKMINFDIVHNKSIVNECRHKFLTNM